MIDLQKEAEEYFIDNIYCDGITPFEEEVSKKCFIAGYKANQNKFSEKQILEWYESMRTQDWKEPSDYFKQKEVYLEVGRTYIPIRENAPSNLFSIGEGLFFWQLKVTDNKIYEI